MCPLRVSGVIIFRRRNESRTACVSEVHGVSVTRYYRMSTFVTVSVCQAYTCVCSCMSTCGVASASANPLLMGICFNRTGMHISPRGNECYPFMQHLVEPQASYPHFTGNILAHLIAIFAVICSLAFCCRQKFCTALTTQIWSAFPSEMKCIMMQVLRNARCFMPYPIKNGQLPAAAVPFC